MAKKWHDMKNYYFNDEIASAVMASITSLPSFSSVKLLGSAEIGWDGNTFISPPSTKIKPYN